MPFDSVALSIAGKSRLATSPTSGIASRFSKAMGSAGAGFGRSGAGVFPAPSILDREIQQNLGVRLVGRSPDVRERFYAISLEATLKHPAVLAICNAARRDLFA